MIYSCCGDQRKSTVIGRPAFNGIDYVEVLDSEAVPLGLVRQQTLVLYCLNPLPAAPPLTSIMISGGESITGVSAAWAALASAPPASLPAAAQTYFTSLPNPSNVLVIGTNKAGDFSTYTLRLVSSIEAAQQDPFDLTDVLAPFDPMLAEVQFSFKVECGPNFDCNPPPANCPPPAQPPPPINYLAKDYGSFRTLLLDRISQLLPTWGASSEADLGIMLAELIAYAGDHLSYQQDAVATEAYIETARSRISLRRHARLVDYFVHDGCNARVWIQLQVQGIPGEQIFLDRTRTRFYADAPDMPADLTVGAGQEEAALLAGVQVFEPICDSVLYPEHNSMHFYTWDATDCCLARGVTEATLLGSFPNLQAGDVLIFQEVLGPQTGNPADADIRHRCAVRLTNVTLLLDPLFSTALTEIQWAADDALPFPVCISSTYLDQNSDSQSVQDVSIVLGNVILADHGLSFVDQGLGTVPSPSIQYPAAATANRCKPTQLQSVPLRFRPRLPEAPVTQAVPVVVVPLPGLGNPVTPGIISLGNSGVVSLLNASGFASLTLLTTNAQGWPVLLGVVVSANAVTPSNIDLSVVYNPPGGAAGLHKQIALERFTNLSLNSGDVDYVVKIINGQSQLIQVQRPSPVMPSGFPAAPQMLSGASAVNLQDLSTPPTTYLTVQANDPAGWPPLFGVQTFADAQPALFDLALYYNPASGGEGVTLPVLVEQFAALSPATAATLIDDESALVIVDTFARAPDPSLSAADLMNVEADAAVPAITLSGTSGVSTTLWSPLQDLLESGATDPVFAVEVESTGVASLRFGDNTNGMMPDANTVFLADYRIGNGTAGNVGADSIIHIASSDPLMAGAACNNPLPATGGTDPESNDQIRRRAPQAFLTQDRAVTMADYEALADDNPQVDRSVASLRWTGSWYTVFVAVEPVDGSQLTSALQNTVQNYLEQYRLAGQDLQLDSPQYVSLEIVLQICVDPDYFQSHVQQALQSVLGSQISPNGQTGYFYPDHFTFGQTVYLSPIYAAARSVPGVRTVTATVFQPQGVNSPQYLASGAIPLGSLQVARLANDPNFPDHGQLTLSMEGGK
jgi:hypothetical protein